jgi:hypothetical protein
MTAEKVENCEWSALSWVEIKAICESLGMGYCEVHVDGPCRL